MNGENCQFLLIQKAQYHFLMLPEKKDIKKSNLGFSEPKTVTAFKYNPLAQEIVLGTDDGSFTVVAD